ncbi:MAG: DNA-primase RepB domain-containing protein [Xanthobacteraceae bacterium]
MLAGRLIDPDAVRKFVDLVHRRAADSLRGCTNARPAVLQLCSNSPDDGRFYSSAYNIGDVEHMVADALIDAQAGKNVYIEPRLVRPGRPNERGRADATLAVFAAVGEHDGDTGRTFAGSLLPSAVVETSPPDNEHCWYFLERAIGVGDAVELGKAMRQRDGGDACSGNPVQPFRIAGLPNYPNEKKRQRGRVIVPTRLVLASTVTYAAEKLLAHFLARAPTIEPVPQLSLDLEHSRPAYCRSRARAILAAEPGRDRSAEFMRAVRYAAMGNMPPKEFESIARQHSSGCAGKYLEGSGDRLRREVLRCFSKM